MEWERFKVADFVIQGNGQGSEDKPVTDFSPDVSTNIFH
jgi:hypothetical protein